MKVASFPFISWIKGSPPWSNKYSKISIEEAQAATCTCEEFCDNLSKILFPLCFNLIFGYLDHNEYVLQEILLYLYFH